MTLRSIALVVVGLGLVVGTSTAGVTVKGLKAAMVDCYTDQNLEQSIAIIKREQWPAGALVADKETEDAIHLTVAGKHCWFDRSQLELDVPGVSDCVDDSGGLASRGLGGKPCPQKKPGR